MRPASADGSASFSFTLGNFSRDRRLDAPTGSRAARVACPTAPASPRVGRPVARAKEEPMRSVTIVLARVALGLSVLLVLATGPSAGADAMLHSQHTPLHPVTGAPLANGFVENIHANGPNV